MECDDKMVKCENVQTESAGTDTNCVIQEISVVKVCYCCMYK